MKRTLIIFLLLTGFNANASEMVDIRTGAHLNYSRVVLQFDRKPEFRIFQDLKHKMIAVDCEIDRIQDLRNVSVHPMDEFLSSVQPVFSGRVLSVNIRLKSPNVNVRHYTLARPYRIVLDVSRGAATVSLQNRDRSFVEPPQPLESVPMDPREVSVATAVKTFVAPSADDPMQIQETERNAENAESDAPVLPNPIDLKISELRRVQDLLHPNRVRTEPQQQPEVAQATPQGWTKVDYGLAILIGFLVLDILVFVYLKINTRPKRSILAHTRARVEEQLTRSKKWQESPQAPPVKQESAAPKFVDVLTSAIEEPEVAKPAKADRLPRPKTAEKAPVVESVKAVASLLDRQTLLPEVQQELDQVDAAIRVDSMIASLSDAVGKPADKFAYVPELPDILQDLTEKMAPESHPEELTKEVLIGQDGMEFVKNLRRLFLN